MDQIVQENQNGIEILVGQALKKQNKTKLKNPMAFEKFKCHF